MAQRTFVHFFAFWTMVLILRLVAMWTGLWIAREAVSDRYMFWPWAKYPLYGAPSSRQPLLFQHPKFYASPFCIREVICAHLMLKDLKIPKTGPPVASQDSLGSIRGTEEVQVLRKFKHTGIRYHFIKDAVKKKSVSVKYTSSLNNRADQMTKALIWKQSKSPRSQTGCFSYDTLTSPRGGLLE